MLISLCAVAQDSAPQAQNGSTTPSTPTSNSAQAQPSSSKTAAPTPAKHSGKKKKHKKNKYENPIADVDSKQPDKVLFDRAEDAMKHGKYDVARLSLQTLINTYPDSEYVARAKLAIGDSWYDEGGAAAYAQAESEYKDFITFFPNMPEAAEAQMKIANIHFNEMEKADRDPTHALRAQDEYRQMILQFPDSPLIPQAKERLLEVQEVLARREYDIGNFYYLRESYPAAIARLKSVADTYPLYSGAADTLYELGNAYEKQVELIRRSKLAEVVKGQLIKQYTQGAIDAYDHILTRYPLEDHASDAKKRLVALRQPIPQATPDAIAEDKKEIASRGSLGHVGKVMENFHRGPDVSEAAKVGEPTLVDPKQASAPDMVRQANAAAISAMKGETSTLTVEKVSEGATPPPNAPVPHSDAAPGTAAPATSGAASDAANDASNDDDTANAPAAGTAMKNDLAPSNNAATSPAPPLPPTQVNDLQGANSSAGSTQSASANSTQQQAAPANPNTESSSKKKKKHHLIPLL
jgi:outer membrane protein assembly factor BamD